MIDLAKEALVPIGEVPRLLPPRPNGKRLHISAVYRWVQRGVRGVKLESVRVGGTTYTSREALQHFAESCRTIAAPRPAANISLLRRRQIEAAGQRVREILQAQ